MNERRPGWPQRSAVRMPLLILCFILCRHIEGQQVQLSLESALQQALSINPDLSITKSQTDVARGQLVQAGLRPNPRLLVQTEDIRPGTTQAPFSFANSTEDYLTVGQTIEVAGKRRGRIQVAGAGVGIAENQQQLTRVQIVSRVTAAYWNAVLADRTRDLASQSLQTYDEDVRYIGNRVKEGVAAEGDLIRLTIERERIRTTLLGAKRDSEQALVYLFRAIGANQFPSAVLTTRLEDSKIQDIPNLESVLAKRKDVAVARASLEQAESNLKLQHAAARPDPEVLVGYKRNSGFDTAYAALQIDLPIHNRNQGNISSAQAQVRVAQSNLQLILNTVRADYESAVRGYRDQQNLIATLPTTITQSQDAERRARAAYREGGIQLFALLDAERVRIQSEQDYARALADLQQAINTLHLATGADMSGDSGK